MRWRRFRQKTSAVQINDFIAKPIDPARLVSVIAKWLAITAGQTATAIEGTALASRKEALYLNIRMLRERLAFDETLVQHVLKIFIEEQSLIVDQWPALVLGKQYDELRLDAHNLKRCSSEFVHALAGTTID